MSTNLAVNPDPGAWRALMRRHEQYALEEIQELVADETADPEAANPAIYYKPLNARRNRPARAETDKSLLLHLMDAKFLRRLRIAYLYWRENKPAKDIAEELGLSLYTVKHVIQRLG